MRPGKAALKSASFVVALSVWLALAGAANAQTPAQISDTVVLADPADPYHSLAVEIARREDLPLVSGLGEALAQDPTFLLWVVSPTHLSDEVLVDFALALHEHPSAVSTGILSGATLEDARALSLRAARVRCERIVAANAENPSARVPASLRILDGGQEHILPLTVSNLEESLHQADYVTFTGHGGPSYLSLEKGIALRPERVPAMPPAVIATGSCNTFRLWSDDSLALTLVAQGAAAYAGFAYSPNEGFLIGEFDGLPMRYTWPEFPIGHVIQVQNRGTLQGFARFPYYFLLGDPRIALGSSPPYQLVDARVEGNGQTLRYTGAPAGIIPVRIAGGAAYDFVEIPEEARAWMAEPFYNARLQMVDLSDDKLILFRHEGGDFSVHLRRHPPAAWVLGDIAIDAVDTTLLFLQQGGGALAFLVAGLLVVLVTAWHAWRRSFSGRQLVAALLVGLGFAALHGAYILARLARLTITSKPVHFHPASLAATFLLSGCGAFLYLRARSWRGRSLAVAVAGAASLISSAGLLALFLVANEFFTVPRLGVPLWNANLGWQPLIAFVLEAALFALTFAAVNRAVQSRTKEATKP